MQSQESFKCRKERQEREPEVAVSEDVNYYCWIRGCRKDSQAEDYRQPLECFS